MLSGTISCRLVYQTLDAVDLLAYGPDVAQSTPGPGAASRAGRDQVRRAAVEEDAMQGTDRPAAVRILVVNVNTSAPMTATIAEAARRVVAPTTEVVALT